MTKYRVRNDDEKGEFEIHEVRLLEAKNRGFIVKAVVIGGLALLAVWAIYAAITGKDAELRAAATTGSNLICLALGYYLKKPDG
jgi:hypothetical protein